MYFQLTVQLALAGFAEFVLHLTRMNPDMMFLHQDSGFLNIAYLKFDIDDQSGKYQFTCINCIIKQVLTMGFILQKCIIKFKFWCF